MLKEKRISVINDHTITKIKGENKIEGIYFRDKINSQKTKMYSSEGIIEQFI